MNYELFDFEIHHYLMSNFDDYEELDMYMKQYHLNKNKHLIIEVFLYLPIVYERKVVDAVCGVSKII